MSITEFLASAENSVLEELKLTRNEEELIFCAKRLGYDFTYAEAKRLFRLLTCQISDDDIMDIVGAGSGYTSNGFCHWTQTEVLMIGNPVCKYWSPDSFSSEDLFTEKSCRNCACFSPYF